MGRCVGLTTLLPLCADCHTILEPQPPGTLSACPGLYRVCSIFRAHIFMVLQPWAFPQIDKAYLESGEGAGSRRSVGPIM